MNANELADLLETNQFLNPTANKEAVTMLRQQQAEIEALKKKIVNLEFLARREK